MHRDIRSLRRDAASIYTQTADRRADRGLHYRNVSNGYWVAFLLPVALYISDLNLHRDTKTAVTIIGLNSLLLCLFSYLEVNFYMLLMRFRKLSMAISGLILLICYANGGPLYEVASYLALYFTFPHIFYNMVKQHPRSFSFGEAVLVTSAFAYRFWGASQTLPFPQPSNHIYELPEGDKLSLFMQLLFFGTVLGCRVILLLQKPWKLFILEEMICLWAKYCVLAFFTRIPTQNDEVAVYLIMWPFKFIFKSPERIRLVCVWAAVSVLTGIYVVYQSFFSKTTTTTIDRKYFHLAITLVFLPGISLDYSLIYCCSAVVFYIFVLIEAIRVLKFEMVGIKFGQLVDERVGGFRDYQDEGRLLLTPIYLLVGCSLPIWLTDYDETNDLKPFQYAACLSGVISIGIGDTFASIGGTHFGRTRWNDSKKTVEGTVCSIIAQLVFAVLILLFDVIPYNLVSVVGLITAIVINAIVEGNTDQIDNLILPLVTFIVINGVRLLFSMTARKALI